MFSLFKLLPSYRIRSLAKQEKKDDKESLYKAGAEKRGLSCHKRMWLLVEIVELFISLLVMHQAERCIILEISLLLVHTHYRRSRGIG